MIPRGYIILICTLFLVEDVYLQGQRTYDRNEWIPVTSSPEKPNDNQEQKANDRILNLDAPAQNFPVTKDHQHVKHTFNESPQFPRGTVSKPAKRTRHPSEYKIQTPPPPPLKRFPQANYYDGKNTSPYVFEQPPVAAASQQSQQQVAPNYLSSVLQRPNQQSLSYVPVPSINPEVPPVNSPNFYNQYRPPVNSSFYQALNPTSINDAFYQPNNNPAPLQSTPSTIIQKTLPILEKHTSTQIPQEQKQNVQLVYVPVENLKQNLPTTLGQQFNVQQTVTTPKVDHSIFNPSIQARQPQQFGFANQFNANNFNFNSNPVEAKQQKLDVIEKDFIQQALHAHKLQEVLKDEINPLYQEGTTAKSKRRPHQPPLAVFLNSQNEAEVSDVLHILKDAKSISVRDSFSSSSPNIFIGPSTLEPVQGFTKFPLPYLNNLNGNRIERKIDQLPFFVAPVSYNAPAGYAKIPLPSPHVGSVVISIPKTPYRTTTARPAFFNPSAFGFGYPEQNFEYQSPRPVQNYLSPNYQAFEQEGNIYQTTLAPQIPFNLPQEDTFSIKPPHAYPIRESIIPPRQQNRNRYKSSEQERYPAVPQTSNDISTTTTPSEDKSQLSNVNTLELAINDFELRQINNQFINQNQKLQHSTTPKPEIVEYEFSTSIPIIPDLQEHTTEKAGRSRVRGRGRGTARPSTHPSLDEYKYTVLEEFIASMKNPTESYFPEADNPPAYAKPPEQVQNEPTLKEEDKPAPSPEVSVQNLPNNQQPTNEYVQGNANIETVPANVYNLGQPQVYNPTAYANVPNQPELQQTQTDSPVNYNPVSPQQEIQPEQPATLTPPVPTKRRRLLRKKIQIANNEVNTELPVRQLTSPGLEQTQIPTQTLNQNIPNYNSDVNSDPASDANVQADLERLRQLAPHLFQPNFDQTYISLQDQAVRSLLIPNALPPTTTQQQELPTTIKYQPQIVPTVEAQTEVIPSTEAEKTTTARTRTRGRVRGRVSTTPATVTSSPRRTANRRRPVSRTSTERVSPSTTELNEYKEEPVHITPAVRQRGRTRGRPAHNYFTEKPSTTENNIQVISEQPSEQEYANVNNVQVLQNAEHYSIPNTQQIIPEPQINNYNISIPIPTPTAHSVIDYGNYNVNPTLPVQVVPTQPAEILQEISSKPVDTEQYVKYNNANIRSGGIINNNPETTTKAATARVRGRTRGRSRFAVSTTTTTTPAPTTRLTIGSQTEATEVQEQEYYGFIRAPNFNQQDIQTQFKQEETNNQAAIQFIGEIRPKYNPPPVPQTTTAPVEEVVTTDAPRPRIRTRTRGQASRIASSYRPAEPEVTTPRQIQQSSTRRTIRTRGRGSAHYRAPENVKRGSSDEDVASQNYPVNFLQKFESTAAPKVTTSSFQITVDPSEYDEFDDQDPNSSYYSANVVPAPNHIQNSDKTSTEKHLLYSSKYSSTEPLKSTESITEEPENNEVTTPIKEITELPTTYSPEDLSVTEITENSKKSEYEEEPVPETPVEQITSVGKGKRRGVWKLVRHQAVEPFELSESQRYETVINDFETIAKVVPFSTKLYSAKKFDFKSKHIKKTPVPEYHKEDFELVSFNDKTSTTTEYAVVDSETTTKEEITTVPTLKAQENIFSTIYEMFGITSKDNTEKDSNKNITTTTLEPITTFPTTTTENPTFPEEITEESPTTTNVNVSNSDVDDNNENSEEVTDAIITTSTAQTKRKKYEVEPWEMRVVKTSTSTEVSHETEICYRGRCVKSKEKKMK